MVNRFTRIVHSQTVVGLEVPVLGPFNNGGHPIGSAFTENANNRRLELQMRLTF